jgi:RNA polymerase sigma factor (sigma-70 family)
MVDPLSRYLTDESALMPGPIPPALARLLTAGEPAAREAAWADFLATHSRLILHVARSLRGDHDAAMDRYAKVLEQLRDDDFHRLRAYAADGRSEFSTWLVVVAQRICLDHWRSRYGRLRATEGDAAAREEEWAARRRLVDLIAADVALSSLGDHKASGPEDTLRVADLYQALESALALLDPRDRLLVKLRFEDGLPMPEVARSLGFPTRFHAYRRLSRVLDDLRRILETAGVRDATP